VKVRFRILFLEEAVEFLDDLEENAREKILYNIRPDKTPVSDINKSERIRKLYFENKHRKK